MSKSKEQKKVRQLYLINIQSHLVSLLELLADNKLLILSGTIVSVQDCLDKIKLNIKGLVQKNNDDFLSFLFGQTALNQSKLNKYQKQLDTLKTTVESLRNQNNVKNQDNNNQLIVNLESYLNDKQEQTRQITKNNPQRQEVQELKNKIILLKQNELKLAQQINDRQKQIRKQKSLSTDFKVQVQSLNQLVKRLQNQNNKYTSKLYQSNQNYQNAKRQIQELKNKLGTFSIRLAQQNLQEIIYKKDIQLFQNQNQRLKNQILILKQQLKYLEIKLQDTVDINANQLQQIKSLSEERLKQINRINIKANSLQECNVDLARQNQNLQKMIQRANQSVILLQLKNQKLQSELISKINTLNQSQQLFAQIQKQKQDLKNQIIQQKNKNNNLNKIIYDTNQKNNNWNNLLLENQNLKYQIAQREFNQKSISESSLSKFMEMMKVLKQKQQKKFMVYKKGLGRAQAKLLKVKEDHVKIKQQLKTKLTLEIGYFQTFIKKELLTYKQKYLIYKRTNQEQQYERHMSLLKQIDLMREDVETKHIKVSEQENRVLDILKRQNQKIMDQTLLRVKSQDYLAWTKPSYINRF